VKKTGRELLPPDPQMMTASRKKNKAGKVNKQGRRMSMANAAKRASKRLDPK
jgi:hypothetical protein